ncbi:MAG: PKD domain-containing protein, partial [Planctomycetes bacterium]|nr:PKD domain-containing protein [Planctomycetota bacterium]
TAKNKPWAAIRHANGQTKPWIDEFDNWMFEVSNETWNGLFKPWNFANRGHEMFDSVTGQSHSGGAVYGMLQEYIISQLRSSPYWTDAVDKKFKYALGGWMTRTTASGYGAEAIQHSPSSHYLTVAGYNGGWDEGEGPALTDPKSLFKAITLWARRDVEKVKAFEHAKVREHLMGLGNAHDYKLGTYEAGPGYALNGLNGVNVSKEEAIAQDENGKSLASGVATLDMFLGRGYLGFATQNYFTFDFHQRNWKSHGPIHRGAIPYPCTQALTLYNQYGLGDYLITKNHSQATHSFMVSERKKKPRLIENVPLTGLYATRTKDSMTVFVLSRKIPGVIEGDDPEAYTNVHFDLPFSSAKSVTLHRMCGLARSHNIYKQEVNVDTISSIPFAKDFHLNKATTGMPRDGLPPNSIFCYVFSGINAETINQKPISAFSAPTTALLGEAITLSNTSSDAEKDTLSSQWNFGGLGTSTETAPTYTFTEPGIHRIDLTVDDSKSGVATSSAYIEILPQITNGPWHFRNEADGNLQHPGSLSLDGDNITITNRQGNLWENYTWLFQGKTLHKGQSVSVKISEQESRKGFAGLLLAWDSRDNVGTENNRFAAVYMSGDGNIYNRFGWGLYGRLRADEKRTEKTKAQYLRLSWSNDNVIIAEYSEDGSTWKEHARAGDMKTFLGNITELKPGLMVAGGKGPNKAISATFTEYTRK